MNPNIGDTLNLLRKIKYYYNTILMTILRQVHHTEVSLREVRVNFSTEPEAEVYWVDGRTDTLETL